MKNFVLSRNEEGYKISNVILKKIKQLENATKKIRKLNDKNLNKRLIKFKKKALKLIDSFDEGRLEQEALLLALKFDVSEEIDRIVFHTNSLIKEATL